VLWRRHPVSACARTLEAVPVSAASNIEEPQWCCKTLLWSSAVRHSMDVTSVPNLRMYGLMTRRRHWPFHAIFTLFIGIGHRAQAFPPLSCRHWAGAQAWSNSLASAPAVSHQAGKGLRGTARAAAEGQRVDPRQVPWWCQSWRGAFFSQHLRRRRHSLCSAPRDKIASPVPHRIVLQH